MRHKFLVLTVKQRLKSVYICGSYRKIKTEVSLFWTTRQIFFHCTRNVIYRRVQCRLKTHDTRFRNRRRLEHCSISKPETCVRVTEMMIYRRLLFIFVISCKQSVNSRVVIYLFIVIHCLRRLQLRLFLRQKFSLRTHMARKTGARKWSRFMSPVSAACVMGITQEMFDFDCA